MARRQFNIRGRQAQRRKTEWLGLEFVSAPGTVPLGSKLLVASLDATELGKLPFTITRTIGMLTVNSDQNAGMENVSGAFGATVVTERALITGIGSLPDPVTEVNSDTWFLYQDYVFIQIIRDTPAQHGTPLFQYKFDSRAQRKVEEGEQVAFVIANSSTAFGVSFYVQLRMLIKLH